MKVLMTTDTVGGVWTYSLTLAASLPDVDFVLASQGPMPSYEQRCAAAQLPNVILESRECLLEWQSGCEADLPGTARWLQRLNEDHEPDLVHLNDYAFGTLPWGVPVVLVAHSCVVSWWRAVHGAMPPPEWDEYRSRVGASFAAVDHVVAPTRAFLLQMLSIHGSPTAARVIHNGCALERFRPSTRLRRDRMVLSAGRAWDQAKNLQTLDEAAQDLGVPVLVAGEPCSPDGRLLRFRHARALGPLPTTQLAERMQRTAIYAAPALYEPFGLSVLEAAAAGCALVLADIPTLRELWEGAAAFVPPRDHRALAGELRSVLDDRQRRLQLAELARCRATRYSQARMGSAYRELYASLRQATHSRPEAAFA
jgi:glycogen synthase